MGDAKQREQICLFAKSLFDRGSTHGSTGNISVRCEDGGLLVTPTNSSFGFLDPAELTRIDTDGQITSGLNPTKELNLHTAFYETRSSEAGAVVHLHSHYSVALSMMPGIDVENFLPPLTPYPIMKLGRVKVLPYFQPGDPAMGEAVRNLHGEHPAIMFANHGPVVASSDLPSAVYAAEELEAAARLALEDRHSTFTRLTEEQIAMLEQH